MNDPGRHEAGRHEAPDPTPASSTTGSAPQTARPGLLDELRDAVSVRTVALVVGVLVVQLAFILSYVGAFHAPRPQDVPVSVVAPAAVAAQVVEQLDGVAGTPLAATAVPDEATARTQLADGSTSAVLVVDPTGRADTLLIASGAGTSVATAAEQVLTQVETAQGRTLTVSDVVPLQSGDARGLSGFYLVIGWIVGGYLVAALLGVARGARPATTLRAGLRLAAVLPYAVLSGIGGAVLVGPVLGALTGHFWALAGVGTLLVVGAAAVTMALQVALGVLGIGVTVLLFVVLGNPSAGGAYQPVLLPPFWRALSGVLPNGVGTDAVRRIVYLGGSGAGADVAVLAAWAVGGIVATLAAAAILHRGAGQDEPVPHPARVPVRAEG